MDVDLAVVVVADDRAERKEEDQNREKRRSPRAEDARERILCKCDAAHVAADRVLPREEHDERRRRTDNPRIDVDTERLHQSLLNRMGHARRRRRIRDRAFARLIREQTAADSREDHRADAAADRRLRTERIVQDEGKHPRYRIDVHDDNDERNEEIQSRHDRYEERRKRRNAAEPAKDHECRQHREGDAHDPRLHAECLLHRERNRICLHRDVDQTERHGDQHGKELCHGGLTECILDVVGRAAVKEPVAARNLVDLRERALYEPRRRPNEGNRPHPKYRPGAARYNGDGNARNIADADTRRRTDAERLERRDRLSPARAASEIARQ